MMKQWITLFVFLFLSLSLSAQQGYGRDIFVSSKGDSLPYRMIHPESVKPGEKYPLVLFLHGAGERGNDNEKQLTHGGQMFLNPVNQVSCFCADSAVSDRRLLGLYRTSEVFYTC